MLTEGEVQAAFVLHLTDRGWDVRTESEDRSDVVATRSAERHVAEVTGTTKATGTDVDTCYGQLLRRMLDDGVTSYALVVPERARTAALRVPATVRGDSTSLCSLSTSSPPGGPASAPIVGRGAAGGCHSAPAYLGPIPNGAGPNRLPLSRDSPHTVVVARRVTALDPAPKGHEGTPHVVER